MMYLDSVAQFEDFSTCKIFPQAPPPHAVIFRGFYFTTFSVLCHLGEEAVTFKPAESP